jgi:PAS domain S-box-containing protein
MTDTNVNPQRLHEAAWPDMFANLQTAYSELTQTQFELERRTAEIEEARDLFQQVIESMSEALFLLDRTGRIVRVNCAAGALLKSDPAEMIGRLFSDVCGTGRLPATPWQLLERAPTGSLTNVDMEVYPKTGDAVPISISIGLVRDQRGKITGVLAVARDITERQRAQEKTGAGARLQPEVARDITERQRAQEALERQARELARSNAELEQFAYVASHDLQEPLRMMASFTQLLARRYRGQLDDDADEFMSYITDGATRMQRLINDLLTYSRVGRLGTEFAPTDCNAVFAATGAHLRAAMEESQATVTADPLPTVLADETQLIQLFQNLIGNAIKFRSERPVQVHVGALRQGRRWQFFVRDNGIGIEPQYAERIFLIFQRLHSRAEYPGTGIGLAICKKIVERHGGRLWVESEPGQGSTFYFTLPMKKAAYEQDQ